MGAEGSLELALSHELEAILSCFTEGGAREGMKAFLTRRKPKGETAAEFVSHGLDGGSHEGDEESTATGPEVSNRLNASEGGSDGTLVPTARTVRETLALAGHIVDENRAAELATLLNELLPGIEALRALDLEEEPPAAVFRSLS